MKKTHSSETTQLSRPARKRNPEESRRRILDAAEEAFALRGYDGARLRDIAQEAGVHHALVHHYYGDKRGLFHEVIQRGLVQISEAGLESLQDVNGLEATIRAFVSVIFEFHSQNRHLLRIIEGAFRDRDSVAYEVTQQSLGTLVVPLLKTLNKRLDTARKAGLIRSDIPTESMILLGFSAIVYRFITGDALLLALGLKSKRESDMAREREYLVQYILSAMKVSA